MLPPHPFLSVRIRMLDGTMQGGSSIGRVAVSKTVGWGFESLPPCHAVCRRGGRVVYCGGLENRFGVTADGGSNPSLSAKLNIIVNDLVKIGIWGAIVGIIFMILWRKGYLLQLTNYVQQTREELRKCTWPTWDELKGSTVVVSISMLILGVFVVLVDQIFFRVFMFLKL